MTVMAAYDFDPKQIQSALDAAAHHAKAANLTLVGPKTDVSNGGALVLAGGCISVTVNNGQICVNLPLGFGSVCLPIPAIFPSGTAAQACLDICTTWGLPTGVKVTVSIAGHVVVSKSFGRC
jgi:hypothetical protein